MRDLGFQDLVRFVIGGTVVVALPLIARRMGPEPSGVLALVPALLVLGFLFLGIEFGFDSTVKAVRAAIYALPTLVIFLLLTYWLLRRTGSVWIALVGALIGWSVSAWLIVAITAGRDG